jgi:hypothetical protein
MDESPIVQSIVGRQAIAPIFGKRKGVKVTIVGQSGDLVTVRIMGGLKEENRAGWRTRTFHPSHLSLLKEET